ncbi:S41 family peptidase [Tessaracoccus sp. ZS01]|uniref:S41 family peptidase n=1 Tax=Tessaracoccus sp. ZS01 TaxID=1906324 RepID=UPI00096F71AE|nr:S41 family peptidase [Tessaracoccus sp. ZS01]MCG6567185.1 PDZ domain-containing protein [Tessaracoccus sp. ZS01]OMG57582.1 peptidase S41 [Tessaracoccus sp. ZS01]
MSRGYRRFPHLHQDEVVFVADDDLWLGPLSGGRAARITVAEGTPRSPRFSPDGSKVAYAATTHGRWDAYVVDLDGGTRRLTWLGTRRLVISGWLDDQHVLLSSDHEGLHRVDTYMYSLSLDGELTRLPWGGATSATVHSSGRVAVASINHRDPSGWKRYRGGMAARLHIGDGQGDWIRVLPEIEAGLHHPTWVGDRLVFTSDLGDAPDVQAQVWSVDLNGMDLRNHTSHTAEEGYIRDATSDGQGVVYHSRGQLFHLASLKAEPQLIELATGIGAPSPVQVHPTDRLEAIVPDNGGDGSLLEWRGAAYYLTHRGGPARALADNAGVRVREPRFLDHTGGKAVWVTDAEGEDALEIRLLEGGDKARRIGAGRLGRVMTLEPNEQGTRIAVGSHDGTVYLVDVARGNVKDIGRSTVGEASGFAWSPDGRYLVWRNAIAQEGMLGQLVGYDVTEKRAFTLTRGQFNDFSPVFTADGKYLVFLSSRTIDPTYDELTFDLSFTNTVRPWLVPLSAAEPAPFGPSPDGWAISEADEDDEKDDDSGKSGKEGKKGKDGKESEQVSVVFDVGGVEDRMVPFPVPSGRYVHLQATKHGFVWQSLRSVGELGALRAGVEGEVKDVVEHFSLKTRKVTTVVEGCDGAGVSGDGERLVVRNGDEVWVQSAEQAPGDDEDARVAVDLGRLRREIDPRAEWRQMFEENSRLMRDHFWRPDFDGTDWSAAVARYRPLLDVVATHDDLLDVLWETVGELNTSHAYVSPPDDDGPSVGYLGATFTRNAKGEVVIADILPGETSDPTARSPLRAAGVAAEPGDVIVAVDGRPTADAPHIGALLQGAAEKVVELTLARGRQKRRVAVVPTGNESPLRYHQWVTSRVEYVRERSGGRIGYVHVPDMVARGWAEFHRLIDAAMACDGVVVDVRFNGGGHTSELVIERLTRRAIGWVGARHHDGASTYPSQAARGPVVFLTNPFAGSDGDIVTAAAQNLGLGPVVGERSWGGVVGIDGRFTLVDGTEVTQPRYWIAFDQHGFGLENHGVDPDIVVEVGPADWESDGDKQLDAAVDEALQRLNGTPAAVAPSFPPPRF